MGTLGNAKTWAPYMNTKDCTQGICSLYCPQLCYLIFPPPSSSFPKPQSSSKFSPLVITIIGILGSAFLLVTYYAIVSKFCGNSTTATREENRPPNEEEENPSHHYEPWLMSTNGLDETLIKKITHFKYKKGDGLVGSNMCSICLGEILEDDILRLLPKCSHAFHVSCIDTWLRSHSNCPLCRANIVSNIPQPVSPPPTLVVDIINQPHDREHINQAGNEETGSSEAIRSNLPKYPFRALSDLGDVRLREISMRRSISMDPHAHETRLSITEILRLDHGEDFRLENDERKKPFHE